MKTLALVIALLASGPAAAAESAAFTARDLASLERVTAPRLSPDGRYVAYQVRETDFDGNRGVNGIWLLDLSRGDAPPRRLTTVGVESSTPRWARDGRLYFLSTRSGRQQLWRVTAGAEPQVVTDLPLDVDTFCLSPDGRRAAVAMEVFPDCDDLACTRRRLEERAVAPSRGTVYDRLFVRHWDTWKNGTRAQLFLVEVDAPADARRAPVWLTRGIDGDVPTKPFGGDEEFVFTPDGRHVIFTARIAGRTEPWSTNTDLWRVPVNGARAPENLTPDGPGYDTGPVVSPDGRTLAWRSMQRAGYESDRHRILLRDLRSGRTRELAADWDRSALALAWAPDGGTLFATADDLGQRPVFGIDVKSGKRWKLTGPGFVESFDVGRKAVVFVQDSLTAPAQVFSVAPAGGRATALTRHNAERLARLPLGEAEPFRFKGWNDALVHGYVVKPARFAAGRKYPVAFIVHGGPHGVLGNHWHYRWNSQTYAGAGYAVVHVDFHGSEGYGQAFSDSIVGDWGGKPLVDLQKGWTAALEQFPFLDGTRACALGASYGGYMIFWMAGMWPDAFKCFVSHDGIFDLRAMAYETEELWFTEWEMQGTPWEKPEHFEKHNPVLHVAKWKTPMLVIHGGRDFRIPDTQGLAAFTALQRRGIESQFLHLPNENHWVLKPHGSLQWHQTVESWLARWLQ